MLSTVTINCQVTIIVTNSGSQLSELLSVSHMSQVYKIVFPIVFLGEVMSSYGVSNDNASRDLEWRRRGFE